MSDPIILSRGNIEITKTLARVGGVTYPINGIGSVLVSAPNRGPGYFLAAIAMVVGLILADQSSGTGWGLVIIGVIIGFVAYLRPYTLVLRTASGDQRALTNRRPAGLDEIKAAIEEAVRLRG